MLRFPGLMVIFMLDINDEWRILETAPAESRRSHIKLPSAEVKRSHIKLPSAEGKRSHVKLPSAEGKSGRVSPTDGWQHQRLTSLCRFQRSKSESGRVYPESLCRDE